jgi:hypothetical protein
VLPDDDHRSKHVGAFKSFNVCFRIIQCILVHLLVLIVSNIRESLTQRRAQFCSCITSFDKP